MKPLNRLDAADFIFLNSQSRNAVLFQCPGVVQQPRNKERVQVNSGQQLVNLLLCRIKSIFHELVVGMSWTEAALMSEHCFRTTTGKQSLIFNRQTKGLCRKLPPFSVSMILLRWLNASPKQETSGPAHIPILSKIHFSMFFNIIVSNNANIITYNVVLCNVTEGISLEAPPPYWQQLKGEANPSKNVKGQGKHQYFSAT